MKTLKNRYLVLGCMSGTSLDGLDLALCNFEWKSDSWSFSIVKAETIDYPKEWIQNLSNAPCLTAEELISMDHSYGNYIGELINDFLKPLDIKPEFIVSHGHTIFHKPQDGYSYQIGNGNNISSTTNIPVIADLRNKDISHGGQGAPLVPIGDMYLFNKYDACLNLGGFSNISFGKNMERLAFDICPVNIILNQIANLEGFSYDSDGSLGRSGKLIPGLLEELNRLEYYALTGPKSLGREWMDDSFTPILSNYLHPNTDILRSLYHHIAKQISEVINNEGLNKILVTGGGAYNTFLIDLLRKQCEAKIVIPENDLVDFKEAVIFAFLGILRIRGENNSLASVTGASKNSSGGVLFGFHD